MKKLAAEWANRPAALAFSRSDQQTSRPPRAGDARPPRLRTTDVRAAGLAPLRLEPRRVLSASIQNLVVPSTAVEGNTVEVSAEVKTTVFDGTSALEFDWTVTRDSMVIERGNTQNFSFVPPDDGDYKVGLTLIDADGVTDADSAVLTVRNAPPEIRDLVAEPIAEGGTTTLSGQIVDPGLEDTFTLNLSWGDFSSPDNFQSIDLTNPGEGATFDATTGRFTVEHRYLNNPPYGGIHGDYFIFAAVVDDDGGRGYGLTRANVSNVPPQLADVTATNIDEGGHTTLTGKIIDPGARDAFILTVNWSDGVVQDFEFDPGTTEFSLQHQYHDDRSGDLDDLFTIRLTLVDDEQDQAVDAATITVRNVPPAIDEIAGVTINEGDHVEIALPVIPTGENLLDRLADSPASGAATSGATIGVGFSDMGVLDTHSATIDWGDGTAVEPLLVAQAPGVGGGNLAGKHVYADNGDYNVSITVTDDDGGQATQGFIVTVNNVAPTLTLDPTDETFVILEGETITIRNLGAFTDPGFNNESSRNPGGPSKESFTYQVDWGDGTSVEVWLPVTTINGGPGIPTSGTLTKGDGGEPDRPLSHHYADNDGDNKYTVTVTLYDDDATLVDGKPTDGYDAKQFEVFVYNVNPTLEQVTGTDLEGDGVTYLTVTWADLGEEAASRVTQTAPFTVWVDWENDGTFVAAGTWEGATPHTLPLSHQYLAPPKPENPAQDIIIAVKIHDDSAGTNAQSVLPPVVDSPAAANDFLPVPQSESGVSNVLRITIDNPGIEDNNVAIDTTPEAPPLEFPAPETFATPRLDQPAGPPVQTSGDDGAGGGEIVATTKWYYELREVLPNGEYGEIETIPAEAMDDLPGLFSRLGDHHYQIWFVRTETGSERLVLDVIVRGGKAIDPSDDSAGGRDRPPTSESRETAPAEPTEAPGNGEGALIDPNHPVPPEFPPSPAEATLSGSLPLMGLVTLTRPFRQREQRSRTWREEIESTLERSTDTDWRRLRWRLPR